MGGFDILDEAAAGKPDPLGGQILRATVTIAPASQNDAMHVTPVRWTSRQPFEVPAGQWEPRGANFPRKGDTCVLVFDHLGDAWVPIWSGRTYIPPPDALPWGTSG